MILIVDDMPEIVEWLVEVIRDSGYYADYSIDGMTALYKMQRVCYSMALIDIRLASIDGNTLASHVKSLPEPFCNTPLVAMTGSRLTADENLFVAVLQKPFMPRDLRAIIAQHARPPIPDLHVTSQGGTLAAVELQVVSMSTPLGEGASPSGGQTGEPSS